MMVLKNPAVILVALMLAACGGGGGSEGTSPFVKAASAPSVGAPVLTMAISSPTPSASAPATVTASLKDSAGAAIAGQTVFFYVAQALGALAPEQSPTNASGIATTQLTPPSPTSGGTGVVTAVVNVNNVLLSQTIAITVAPAP